MYTLTTTKYLEVAEKLVADLQSRGIEARIATVYHVETRGGRDAFAAGREALARSRPRPRKPAVRKRRTAGV